MSLIVEVGPSIAARGSGGALKLPSTGPGEYRPPKVFWCILGINLHFFECLLGTICVPIEHFILVRLCRPKKN